MKIDDFRDEIEILLDEGLTNPEISEVLGFDLGVVRRFVRSEYGGNKNFMKRHTKHKHLRAEALRMKTKERLGDNEIMRNLNLTKSELLSCLHKAYHDPSLSHLRVSPYKVKPWTDEDTLFLLRWSGILPISEIAKHVKGGVSVPAVKGKLAKLKVCSTNINGISVKQFEKLFNKLPEYYIETAAKTPGIGDKKFQLVPWAFVEELLKKKKIRQSKIIREYVYSMAKFQKWLHGDNYWYSMTKSINT